MDYPKCDRSKCINWKEGHCTIKNPEKEETSCLNFEDSMDYLRLKADAIRGTLA